MLQNLLKNSFSSFLVPVVKMSITFVMAPVIVQSLGNYDYGIWEMVFAIVGYMGILDLGLTPAIIRNVARHNALNNKQDIHRIYSSAMAFFFPVGVLMAAILTFLSFYPQLFFVGDTPVETGKYTIFLLIVAVQVFASFVGLVFDSVLEGFQQYSFRNNATIVVSVVSSLIMYPLLKNGGGLLVLAAGNALGFSLKILLYGYILSLPKSGGYRFHRNDVDKSSLKELLSFGGKSFIYTASFSIGHFSDNLVLGACLGPVAVTFYTIPVNLLSQVRNLVWSAVRVFMPVFSELDSLNQKEQARQLLFSASRYGLGFIFPVMVGVSFLGPDFIRFWLGEEYATKGFWVLQIMTFAYILQWLCPFRTRFLTGVGKLGLQAKLGVISVIFNLGLSLVLVRFVDKEGVALGTLLPEIFIQPYLLWYTCRVAEGTLTEYTKSVFLPLIIPVFAHVLCLWSFKAYWPATSLYMVMCLACLSMLIYLPVFICFGMFGNERKFIIARLTSKFGHQESS